MISSTSCSLEICAVVAGANDWVAVDSFGKAKQAWFARFLALPNMTPSHDTFGRVFALFASDQFQACFLSWVQALAQVTEGQVIAIDGKTLHRSLGNMAILPYCVGKEMETRTPPRKLRWVGDSKDRLLEFPKHVQHALGRALGYAQFGATHPHAKSFRGIASGVFEIVERFQTDTYRAVYAVQVGEHVYVLHAFQKKSKQGIKTPKQDVDMITRRYRDAVEWEKQR